MMEAPSVNDIPQTEQASSLRRFISVVVRGFARLQHQAIPILLMLVLVAAGFAVQWTAVLSHQPLTYWSSQWFDVEIWWAPVESGAQQKRFTQWGALTDIHWNSEYWLATTSAGQVLASTDLRLWNERQLLAEPLTAIALDAQHDELIATGMGGFYISYDAGDRWEPMSVSAEAQIQGIRAIAYGGGYWVAAIRDTVLNSDDGWTWNRAVLQSRAESIDIKQQLSVSNSASGDAQAFTENTVPFAVAYGPSGWRAIGGQRLLQSVDGQRWAEIALPADMVKGEPVAIAASDAVWLLWHTLGLWISRDGLQWQFVDANLPGAPQENASLQFANGQWVASNGNDIYVSDDVQQWQLLDREQQAVPIAGNDDFQQAQQQYSRWLPPLSLLLYALALTVFLRQMWIQVRARTASTDEDVPRKAAYVSLNKNISVHGVKPSNEFSSDKPVTAMAEDLLNRQPIAKALSQFIRNRSSSKPFTLGISGDWGSGKSSLMYMIADDLKRTGVMPVWFNGWHHQDTDLLSGLMVALQQQGLPKLWHLKGILFRGLLLVRRLQFRALMLFGLLIWSCLFLSQQSFVIDTLVDSRLNKPFYFSSDYFSLDVTFDLNRVSAHERIYFPPNDEQCRWKEFNGRTFTNRQQLFAPVTLSADQPTFLLPPDCQDYLRQQFARELGSGLTLLYFAASSYVLPALLFMTGFVAALSNLLGTFGFNVRGRSNIKAAAGNDPNAVAAVKQRLREINWALHWAGNQSLVFFIDDLDRMDSEKLHELMEILNMLVSDNREAFFVLGMDYERVVNHLDSQLQKQQGTAGTAALYLHKMVNVVFTPEAVKDYQALIAAQAVTPETASKEAKRERFTNLLHKGSRWADQGFGMAAWGVCALLLALSLRQDVAQPLYYEVTDAGASAIATPLQNVNVQTLVTGSTSTTNSFADVTNTATTNLPLAADEVVVVANRSYINGANVTLLLVMMAIVLLVIFGVENRKQPDDSIELKTILKAFAGSFSGITNTPRQAKRSTNLIRMVALYQQSMNHGSPVSGLQAMTDMVVIFLMRNLGLIQPDAQAEFIRLLSQLDVEPTPEQLAPLQACLANHSVLKDNLLFQQRLGFVLQRFVTEYLTWVNRQQQCRALDQLAIERSGLNDILQAFH